MVEINELRKQIESMDLAIKSGNMKSVASELKSISIHKIPRVLWVDFASLARRCQLPELIIRWLNPIVRPEKPLINKATPMELAAYGNALTRIGSFTESKEILFQIDPKSDFQVYFYRALLAIQQWDYESAIPSLISYIAQTEISNYQRLVGKLNLGAAYSALGDYLNSETVLTEILQLPDEFKLIKSNGFEIQAQNFFYLNQYQNARASIQKSLDLTSDASRFYSVFKKKWLYIIDLFENNIGFISSSMVDPFREYCREENDWESLRDIDFFLALKNREEPRFFNVYYGTNFSSYQALLKRRYNYNFEWPNEIGIIWSEFFDRKNIDWPILDLQHCSFGKSEAQVSTPKLRDLVRLLTSDIYRPFSFGEVFNKVYPGEYYNAISSPAKLYRLIQRLRTEIDSIGIPVKIEVAHNKVRFIPDSPFLIVKSAEESTSSMVSDNLFTQISELDKIFQDKSFTANEASQILNLSPRSARRILNNLIKDGLLDIHRFGPKTTYTLAHPLKKKSAS